jgi:hypothetical protein
MYFLTQISGLFNDMSVNCAEIPYFITEFLAVLTVFNGDLPIRVDYILDPPIKLDFLVTFLLDLPVLLVSNRQKLLYKAA